MKGTEVDFKPGDKVRGRGVSFCSTTRVRLEWRVLAVLTCPDQAGDWLVLWNPSLPRPDIARPADVERVTR